MKILIMMKKMKIRYYFTRDYSASKGKVYGFARGLDSAESTGLSGRPGPSVKYLYPIHMAE